MQEIRFKITHVFYACEHAGNGGRCDEHFLGWVTNILKGCLVGGRYASSLVLSCGLIIHKAYQLSLIKTPPQIYQHRRTMVALPWWVWPTGVNRLIWESCAACVFLKVVCRIKPGGDSWMFHVNYKPPSSCNILICSGWRPNKVILLKKFQIHGVQQWGSASRG